MTRLDLVVVDLQEVHTELQMHEALAGALDFPGWYGNNWNALWDAITGLVDMPVRLRFRGWHDFERRLPEEACYLRNLFVEMSTELPNLASEVLYE
jgi:RNAse (barnase) inhibitor barstar